jgi:hypothetical protein
VAYVPFTESDKTWPSTSLDEKGSKQCEDKYSDKEMMEKDTGEV